MRQGLMCVAGITLALLLLLIITIILRLVVLLVQIVTLRYTLTIGALVFTLWFVKSRRQRYAKGFYSCSRVPQTQMSQDAAKMIAQSEDEKQEFKQKEMERQATSLVETHETTLKYPKMVAMAPPSETESEDDENESMREGETSVDEMLLTSTKSLTSLRTRSRVADEELQRRQATRFRSSSAVGDRRPSRMNTGKKTYCSSDPNVDLKERKCVASRRRAGTCTTNHLKQNERSRRATFPPKLDVSKVSRQFNSNGLEDALRSDGYWIGDFRVQRRLVPRRSPDFSPKAK